jgi:hypothetical protein
MGGIDQKFVRLQENEPLQAQSARRRGRERREGGEKDGGFYF